MHNVTLTVVCSIRLDRKRDFSKKRAGVAPPSIVSAVAIWFLAFAREELEAQPYDRAVSVWCPSGARARARVGGFVPFAPVYVDAACAVLTYRPTR